MINKQSKRKLQKMQALKILINFITMVIKDYTMVRQPMILQKEKD